jgi:hypothetical protein
MYSDLEMRKFNTLLEKVNFLQTQSTTFDQLTYALHDDVEIVNYLDLPNYTSIEQLFSNSLNVILFFPVEDKFNGHYACMMFHPDLNTISYFCSYGFSPMRNIILSNYLKKFNEQTLRLLPNLILNFTRMGGKFLTNSYQFQEKKNSVSVCGQHCVFRIMNRDIINPTEYQKFFKLYNLTPDQIVSLVFM